jgi:hypothetical protein
VTPRSSRVCGWTMTTHGNHAEPGLLSLRCRDVRVLRKIFNRRIPVNYKHAAYIFIMSAIASSLLAATAALSNGQMKSGGGGGGGGGGGSGSPGGRSPGGQQGGGFFVPGSFQELMPTGTHPINPGSGDVYINSPWVPTNPSFGPTPTQRPVTSSPKPYSPYGPVGQ